MNLRIQPERADWIHLAQGGVQWQSVVNPSHSEEKKDQLSECSYRRRLLYGISQLEIRSGRSQIWGTKPRKSGPRAEFETRAPALYRDADSYRKQRACSVANTRENKPHGVAAEGSGIAPRRALVSAVAVSAPTGR
jgi:hypothetical protein